MYFRAFILTSTKSKVPTPLNVTHPQVITPSHFLGGGEVQAGSHSLSALLHMYTLLSSPISTLDSSLNITIPVTIYRQIPPSYPVSLVDLPNPNRLCNILVCNNRTVTIWSVDGQASGVGRWRRVTVCSGAPRATWWQDYYIVTRLGLYIYIYIYIYINVKKL